MDAPPLGSFEPLSGEKCRVICTVAAVYYTGFIVLVMKVSLGCLVSNFPSRKLSLREVFPETHT